MNNIKKMIKFYNYFTRGNEIMKKSKVALFIPTFNAGKNFEEILTLIDAQDDIVGGKYIIDSSSTDDTVSLAKKHNFDTTIINPKDFGHGKTRTQAAKYLSSYDYVIFMTQDIYLQNNALENLVNFIENNSKIAVAYGKQEVDMRKGNIFEYRSREYNYPEQSMVKSKADISNLGIKTVFSSDAFAIYDLNKLKEINYFSDEVNFSEDMYAAAQFINKSYSIGYCAEAKVFHTHNYSLKEEFNRYRYIGGFHKDYPEIQEQFGGNTSEGIKLVFNELKYLLRNGYVHLVPESICRSGAKYLGYRFIKK